MTEPALDPLLARLGRQRFIFYQFHTGRSGPDYLAGVHHWGEAADVVILVDQHHACAYRTPIGDTEGREIDIFDPEAVYWWYTASPGWTIRNLLELPQPAHPRAPRELIDAPGIYRIPQDARKSVRVSMRQHR